MEAEIPTCPFPRRVPFGQRGVPWGARQTEGPDDVYHMWSAANQRETDSFLVNGEWNSHFWGKEENNRRNRVSSWEAWKQDQVQIEEGFRAMSGRNLLVSFTGRAQWAWQSWYGLKWPEAGSALCLFWVQVLNINTHHARASDCK